MLILASTSPRRIELVQSAGLDFITASPKFNEKEISTKDIAVEEYVQLLSKNKALSLVNDYKNDVILAADTIVVYNNEILNKPIDEEDAFRMLKKLNGKKHSVLTGVCIIKGDLIESFYERSEVTFNKMTDEEIYAYIETKEPMDKAGAYAIQGIGSKFVKSYDGDFHTIMGLPLKEVLKKLKDLL
ncbi:Maf family protein [Acholeplasma hippikon]|nr:Maf family protein [Acholeplasma hippikon]